MAIRLLPLLSLLPTLAASFTMAAMSLGGDDGRGRAGRNFSPRVQGLDFLDETGSLWQLPRSLVPLPHERLHLAQAIEGAKLPRGDAGQDTLSAHEAHATFLPLQQALAELEATARQEERRCLVGITGASSAAFARLLAAVLDSEHAPYPWARRVRCAVVSTAGYVQGDEEEPFARPDAYDVTRLASDMQRLRKPPSWSDVDLVDLAGAEGFADLRLVLVHGRHVLRREGEWEALAGQFDFTVDLQRSDDDVTGSTELKDSLGRPYVPSEVASRVLRAQMELLEWQNADDADLSLRFQQRADGSLLFLPETLSIVPALRRRPSLLAAGLNPSHQKSLQLSELKVGDVNRAAALTVSVGGKGQHFAIAANRLGEGSATVAHFLGRRGEEGEQMRKALEQMGVDQEVEWHQGATRTCTTILEDSGRMTELIEPSDCIPKTAVDALLGRLRSRAQRSAGVALCGTFPPGVQEEVYAGLAESVGRDTVLLLDGWKGVEKTLASKRVNVLKINADELGWLTHETDLNAAAATAMRLYMAPGGHLAVTRGANSAFLFSHVQSGAEGPAGMRVAEFVLQPLAAVNPIGAGDTCSAVLLYALCAGQEPEEAFAFALAAASASCLNIAGAHFKAADAVSLYHKMERKPTRTLPLS